MAPLAINVGSLLDVCGSAGLLVSCVLGLGVVVTLDVAVDCFVGASLVTGSLLSITVWLTFVGGAIVAEVTVGCFVDTLLVAGTLLSTVWLAFVGVVGAALLP